MKSLASLLALLFFAQLAAAQRTVVLTVGESQAERATAQAEQSVPPPQPPRRTIDVAKLQHDADELATLAASIPPAVDQTTHGVLPKDTLEKLKHIEKLAKHLRGELSP